MAQATTDLSARTPEQVFAHHGQATHTEDLDALMQDFAETACLITSEAVFCGKAGIRDFFARFIQMLPRAQWTTWTAKTRFADNLLLMEWTAESERGSVTDGVDTFIFRDGLIQYQTVHFTVVPKPLVKP
jgi:hypothetical protein